MSINFEAGSAAELQSMQRLMRHRQEETPGGVGTLSPLVVTVGSAAVGAAAVFVDPDAVRAAESIAAHGDRVGVHLRIRSAVPRLLWEPPFGRHPLTMRDIGGSPVLRNLVNSGRVTPAVGDER